MITLKNINLSSIDLSGIDLRGIKLGLGGRGGGSGDGFPVLPGDVTRWHFGGLTNEMMAAMDDPRIEDADHKGRFLSFKNFAWKGMSGVGGYGDENYQTFYKFTLDDYVFIASPPSVKHMNFTFRVTGLQPGNKLTLAFFGTTNTVYGTWDKDGIYTVDADIVEAGKPTYFYNGYGSTRGEFTIEILPLYPGALVFDGVDDYGVCENFPILTKEKGYTVVALRQWISMGEGISGLVSNVKNWFNDGAFVLEYNSNNATNKFVNRPVSFGKVNIEMDLPNNFTYQTSKSYKGVPITTGSFKGTNSLFVGKLSNIIGNCSNVAIWELVFLDHDATEEELTKIKDYFVKTYPWLFPDQAWTVTGKTNEDEDRATIANITGNGNDLVLSNFAFSGNSGYGLYNIQKFTNWSHVADRGDIVKNGYSVTITNSKITGSSTNYNTDILYSYNSSSTTIIFKVTGLVDGQKIFLGRKSVTDAYVIDKDGIYRSDYNIPQKDGKVIVGIGTVGFIGECNITIEQIPEYEGYLVTDGVDDSAISKPFKIGKNFTIIGEWKFMDNIITRTGIVKSPSLFVYNENDGLKIFINSTNKASILNTKTLRAICSDGRVYSEDWSEMIANEEQSITSSGSSLLIGINGSFSAKIALKNIAIYNDQLLSKDDCIKAYNYLQTLKAK